MKRSFGFPHTYQTFIENRLVELDYTLDRPSKLAEAIKKLSDFYIQNPLSPTPWHEPWAQAAYLAYFWPLNTARTEAVFEELKKVNFFQGIDAWIDYGSGISPITLQLEKLHPKSVQFVEKEKDAIELHKKITKKISSKFDCHWHEVDRFQPDSNKNTLIILSYVLTEIGKLPEWMLNKEALLIIEPSTRDRGRKLSQLRESLMERDYFVWAPCTHQGRCPLIHKSKTDWCHDRIFFEAPDWWLQLESLLPMKNKTITFSYLAMRKKKAESSDLARITGDLLEEKGKYRQLVCRGEDREFLSWLKKVHKKRPDLLRGETITLPENLLRKGDELRL